MDENRSSSLTEKSATDENNKSSSLTEKSTKLESQKEQLCLPVGDDGASCHFLFSLSEFSTDEHLQLLLSSWPSHAQYINSFFLQLQINIRNSQTRNQILLEKLIC
jgi:hypothetical protein